ncbi:hypothetical protein H072_1505 [Dactylellina haptotyla CBS 200.50]|uniref:Uncharacterized protein n=1 Tax=Dactylellina haptotyla (strain CBS 200.50) TaxID=1284197 RepID=S8CA19_DACHA|nr:hypothetical protein H072_1505 [Dactylellina haptotyla CBS 200.50]
MTLNGAALPPRQSNDGSSRFSQELENQRSTGRGGAGNFSNDPETEDEDFATPPIKSPVYTSGRGGTGNMQNNDFEHPEYARAAQDVEMVARRPSTSDYHGGRSGAGNVFSPSEEEYLAAEDYEKRVKYDRSIQVDHSRHDYRGWADKGKDFLFGRRRK